ncbi:MAG: rhomboid family intramembrane serine protease [Bacillota bacterium]|nr:rhomboid family intramembrane serine protease [Bacillota bacterium]
MNKEFLKLLVNNLITAKEYQFIRDEAGRTISLDNAFLLQKSTHGAWMVLETVDGDAFTAEQIKQRMELNMDVSASMNANNSNIFVEIFIFNRDIPEDKLNVIKNSQSMKFLRKKYYVCYTVRLDNKEVTRHFKIPAAVDGLDGFLQDIVNKDVDETIELVSDFGLIQNPQQYKEDTGMQVKKNIPVLTYSLIGINILVWIAMMLYKFFTHASDDSVYTLFGVKYNELIIQGQIWRLFTPVFIHLSVIHLAVNTYSLYSIGPMVENIFGKRRFLFIYLAAGIFGNIGSFIFSNTPSAGASGAIFGLLGALVYIWQKNRRNLNGSFIAAVATTIIFNLFYGFANAGIDNFAHLGGLIGGYLSSYAVGLAVSKQVNMRRTAVLCLTIFLAVAGTYFGFTKPSNVAYYKINKSEDFYNQGRFDKAGQFALEALKLDGRDNNIRMYGNDIAAASLINQGKAQEAEAYAKALVNLNPARGHYLVGLCYYNLKDFNNAKSELKDAYRLDPSNSHARQVYESIP